MSLIGFAGKLLPRFARERIVLGRIRGELRKRGATKAQVEVLMTGWKTKAGGLLGILTGLTMILKEVAEGTFNFDHMIQGATAIAAALSVLGLGHKIEKGPTPPAKFTPASK